MELEDKKQPVEPENKEYKEFFERIVGYLKKHDIEAKAYALRAGGFGYIRPNFGIGIHRDAFPESFVKSEKDQEIFVCIDAKTIIPLGNLIHEYGLILDEDTWQTEHLDEWREQGLEIAAKAIAKSIRKYLEKSSKKCVDNPEYCPKYEKGKGLGDIMEKYVRKKSVKYAEKALEKYCSKEDNGLYL